MSQSANNKRIAKNTLLLYIRTFFVMAISLYTSRVLLEALGVENYGIYQVVGGMVAMFSVISSSLTSAISRFITFEIGTGNMERLRKIFSTSVSIQLLLGILIFVLVEAIGMWFMETRMQIPDGRMSAARWVLHCSSLTFCINLLSVPYNACIVAHERMKAFAYVSILEVLLKLLVCYLIIISPIDTLITYAILLLLIAILIRIIYAVYCHRNFEECRTSIGYDKPIFKEMLGFSGWSFFNNSAFILNGQGVNMLMNVFFGVTVNAARGIANQVEGAVLQFVNSFTTAINPQITKSYANGDLTAMHKLVCRGAKFSFFMILLMALPIILEARQILEIWLVEVPEYAVAFVQLSLIMGMCDCIGSSGYTACMATGKLRTYSLVITSIGILEFPLAWLFFSFDYSPIYAYYTYIVIKIIVLIARMFLLRRMVGLGVSMYAFNVFKPIVLTTLVAIILPILVKIFFDATFLRLIFLVLISVISVSVSALFLGMTAGERNMIVSKLFNKVFKR